MNQHITADPVIAYYRHLHDTSVYGVTGNRYGLLVQTLILELKPRIILNYGCGQTDWHQRIDLMGAEYYGYDPAIPERADLPVSSADLLINTDVLEHIAADRLPEALAHMRALSSNALFVIATRPDGRKFPSGEDLHCTLMPAFEWRRLLLQFYPTVELAFEVPDYCCGFVTWKSSSLDILDTLYRMQLLKKRVSKRRMQLARRIQRWIFKSDKFEDLVLTSRT
jgi:hypothetical protein